MTDPRKDIFEMVKDKGYFSDKKEFDAFYSNESNKKDLFDMLSSDGYFTDFNEFNAFVGDVKKKASTPSDFGSGPSSFTSQFEKGLQPTTMGGEEVIPPQTKKPATKTLQQTPVVQEGEQLIKKPSIGDMLIQSSNRIFAEKQEMADATSQQIPTVVKEQQKRVVEQKKQQTLTESQKKMAGKVKPDAEMDWSELPNLIESEVVKQFVAPIAKTIGIIGQDIEKQVGSRMSALPGMPAYKPSKVNDFAAYKFGQMLDQYADIFIPVSEESQNSFAGQLIKGGAQLGLFAAAGMASEATGLGPVIMPAIYGAMSAGAGEYETAYNTVTDAQTLSDDQFYQKYGKGDDYQSIINYKNELSLRTPEEVGMQTFLGSAAIGTLDFLPVMQWMNRVDKTTGGAVSKAFSRFMLDKGKGATGAALMGGAEESIQEGISQLFQNLNAIAVYDKTREIMDGVGEGMGYGFILGGTLNGLTVAIQNKLSQPGLSAKDKAILQEALNEVKKKQEDAKDIKPDDAGKMTTDSPAIQELKKKKTQLEFDLADSETNPDLKIKLAQEVQKVDQQIKETKVSENESATQLAEAKGEVAQLQSDIEALETQKANATPATQEVIQSEIDEKTSILESLKIKEEAPAVEQPPTPPATTETTGNEKLDELIMTEGLKAETAKMMAPKVAERMADIENEFLKQGYIIQEDYDRETIILDAKTGEQIDPEELSPELIDLAGKYEGAIKNFSDRVEGFEKMRSDAKDKMLGKADEAQPKISKEANNLIDGTAVYKRFSPQEQRGLSKGGPVHVEATLLLGKDERAGKEGSTTNEQQESKVEQFSKENGVWHDDVTQKFTEKYGEPIASGQEALVWADPSTGSVIKSQNTHQYGDLLNKIDSITLHNSLFPETAIEVLGYGRNSDGDFQIVIRQPFIQADPDNVVTKAQIKDYMKSMGFENIEGNDYANSDTIIMDLHTGNAILDKDGNIHIIDPIMMLNTPEQGYGGKRKVDNKIEPITKKPKKDEQQTKTTERKESTKRGDSKGGQQDVRRDREDATREKPSWFSGTDAEVKSAIKSGEFRNAISSGVITLDEAKTELKKRGIPLPKEFKPQELRGKKPLDERKLKGKMKMAAEAEVYSPIDLVRQYFISGGRIGAKAIEQIFGNKRGKSVGGEKKARISYYRKDPSWNKSIDEIAHIIYENQPDTGDGDEYRYSDQDIRQAVEEVILRYNNPSDMANDLIKEHGLDVEERAAAEEEYVRGLIEQKRKAKQDGFNDLSMDSSIATIEDMTDEEIQMYAEGKDKAFDKEVEGLSENWWGDDAGGDVSSELPEGWDDIQPPSSINPSTLSIFEKANQMFNDIKNADGSMKKRKLADARKKFMEENPTMKRIDDNIKTILDQLSAKELITRKGDCP